MIVKIKLLQHLYTTTTYLTNNNNEDTLNNDEVNVTCLSQDTFNVIEPIYYTDNNLNTLKLFSYNLWNSYDISTSPIPYNNSIALSKGTYELRGLTNSEDSIIITNYKDSKSCQAPNCPYKIHSVNSQWGTVVGY